MSIAAKAMYRGAGVVEGGGMVLSRTGLDSGPSQASGRLVG